MTAGLRSGQAALAFPAGGGGGRDAKALWGPREGGGGHAEPPLCVSEILSLCEESAAVCEEGPLHEDAG